LIPPEQPRAVADIIVKAAKSVALVARWRPVRSREVTSGSASRRI
jgi:hypothetical protein